MSTNVVQTPAAARGLKGVVAADTSICDVDGTTGQLTYRGYSIDDLAAQSSFEEIAWLLFHGELPTPFQLADFKAALAEYAKLSAGVLDCLRALPRDVNPMAALRTAVSVAGICDPAAEDGSEDGNPEETYRKAVRLAALFPTVTAAIHRLRQGLQPLEPKPELGHAGSFMYLLNGTTPSPDEIKAMDLILILHAEHGFNASTFAARVIVATFTDVYSAICGAIGALKGKLHGGANTEVLKTLLNLQRVENVAGWVEETLARKEKFMGFGHAVYRAEDPRAKYLKELSRRLSREKHDPRWYDISEEIERLVVPAIGKHCNVDFYSASLQHYMGIPGELFTCVFATSRIAGWCAHILEQTADNKIIRPSANYVGAEPRKYVPPELR